MGETADSIRRDIDRERNQLEDNLESIEARVRDTTTQVQDKVEEVQEKVKDATDWRAQFEKRPMVGLAVAFGGGVLLASMLGGGNDRRSSSGSYYGGYQPQSQGFSSYQGNGGMDVGKQHASSTFDNVKGALMGVAAAQLKNVLSDALPGFSDEYRQVERETAGSGSNSTNRNSAPSQSSAEQTASGERRQSI